MKTNAIQLLGLAMVLVIDFSFSKAIGSQKFDYLEEVPGVAKASSDVKQFIQSMNFPSQQETEMLEVAETYNLLSMAVPKVEIEGLKLRVSSSGGKEFEAAMIESGELSWVGSKKIRIKDRSFKTIFEELTKEVREKGNKKRASFWFNFLPVNRAQAADDSLLGYLVGSVVLKGYDLYAKLCSSFDSQSNKLCTRKDKDAVAGMISSKQLKGFKCDDDRLNEITVPDFQGEMRYEFRYNEIDQVEKVIIHRSGSDCEYTVEKGKITKMHGNFCQRKTQNAKYSSLSELALNRIMSCCRDPECVSETQNQKAGAVENSTDPGPAPKAPVKPAVK